MPFTSPPLQRAFAAVVYVSEGRRTAVLDVIERVAREATAPRRPVALVNVFRDAEYNRTGFTLAGRDVDDVRRAALDVAQVSLREVDMRAHDATHPRVGVVDHVSCHALAGERAGAAKLAKSIGEGLGTLGVPVKLYGDAASDGIGLDEIRRRSGYFSGAAGGRWTGEFAVERGFAFDYGPSDVSEREGFGMVGAVPWVCNYNVPLAFTFADEGLDAETRMTRAMAFGRAVAKRVSARGGGLPSVQSMALPHGGKVEVACNLLDVDASSTVDVQRATAAAVAETDALKILGAGALAMVEDGYVTNQTPESIIRAIDAIDAR